MKKWLLALFLLITAGDTHAQMTLRTVRDSLFIPWELQYGPDGHIWFTQKNGYICRMDPATGWIDTLYHETNTVIQGEGGMLGLVLHPNFPSPPFVFVAYDYMNGSTYTARVVKYQYDAVNNTLHQQQVVIDNIGAANYHNGCRLLMIGDYLYITTGDATNPSVAQNTDVINGKILRVVQDGFIPTDNPKPGSPIWSWGHRNPQGLVYANGRLYESEHGPNNDDEVNIIQKGRNYGWPNVEGYCDLFSEMNFCTDSNVVEPLHAWTPTLAVCGLDYYDHPMFPSLQKSLIMCTLKDSHLYQLKLNSTLDSIANISIVSQVNKGRLRDICISPEGRIYISTSNSDASGTVNHIDKILELYDPNFVSVPQTPSGNVVNIYPNPAHQSFTIRVNAGMYSDALQYCITDAVGRSITANTLEKNGASISTATWPAGVYFIRLRDGKRINISQKLIKE